jgi:hypothetical protein
MVCFAVPTVAAIIHHATRKNISSWKSSTYHLWLSLLLIGGAIFGIVDHLWNGELLLIGENTGYDLLLGAVITTLIFIVWAIIVFVDKKTKLDAKTV